MNLLNTEALATFRRRSRDNTCFFGFWKGTLSFEQTRLNHVLCICQNLLNTLDGFHCSGITQGGQGWPSLPAVHTRCYTYRQKTIPKAPTLTIHMSEILAMKTVVVTVRVFFFVTWWWWWWWLWDNYCTKMVTLCENNSSGSTSQWGLRYEGQQVTPLSSSE